MCRRISSIGAHLAGRRPAADIEAAFRSRRTRHSASTTGRTAPAASAPKSMTARASRSSRNGRRHAPERAVAAGLQKQRTSASACASSRSRTMVLVTALRNSCAEISAGGAAHPQHGFRLLVVVIGQHGGDHIDGAGAVLQRLPGCRHWSPCRRTRIRHGRRWDSRCSPPRGLIARRAGCTVPAANQPGERWMPFEAPGQAGVTIMPDRWTKRHTSAVAPIGIASRVRRPVRGSRRIDRTWVGR